MISLEKWKILTPLQNLHRNVVYLGILIAAKVLKKCPKSKISPNLVTLNSKLIEGAARSITHFLNNLWSKGLFTLSQLCRNLQSKFGHIIKDL